MPVVPFRSVTNALRLASKLVPLPMMNIGEVAVVPINPEPIIGLLYSPITKASLVLLIV